MSILPCLPGGDPINFIDPDGMTRFYVDLFGRIISTEERMIKNSEMSETDAALDNYDQVIIIGEDGQIIDSSPKYEVGTIKLYNNSNSELNGKDFTILEVNDETAAKAIFESLSKNITGRNRIEFGINIMDDGKFCDVFTGHTKSRLEGFNEVFMMRLNQEHTFDEINHSHTNNACQSGADELSAKWVLKQLKVKAHQNKKPKFNVFDSWGGKYYPYKVSEKKVTKKK